MKEVTKIKLEKKDCYAITTPGQIIFLSDCSEEELKRTINEISKEPEETQTKETNNMVSLAIIPTYNCNLCCIYCYSNGGRDKNIIDIEVAKKAIDVKKKDNPNSNILDLYFVGGGEPLLHFNVVKDIVTYAKALFNEVIINVVTNGTGNKEVMDWLIENNANIRVSFDSLNQNEQRPLASGKDSYTIVKNNINYLISNKANVMIQCIITSLSLEKMKEIIDELVSLGVKVVKFEPCLMTDVSRGDTSLQPDPIKFANALIDAIEYVANNDFDIMIDTGYFSKPMDGNYCGMANGNFTLTPEGMITSCVEVSRKCEPYSDKVIYGEVQNGILINNKSKEFLEKLNYKNQIGGCCDCELRFMCLGGCPMANIWQNGLPLTKSQFTCTIEHIFLPKILTKMLENDKLIEVMCENPTKSIE